MLILFDIDLTLVDTGGSGMTALAEAGRAIFGEGFRSDGVAYAGRLDPLIIADLLAVNGVEPTPGLIAELRHGYAGRLEGHLRGRSRALPGVHRLLGALRGEAGVTLGLLTGNFEVTGLMKLAAAGIDAGDFAVRAWGDDSPHTPPSRDHLPPVAISRFHDITGRRIPSSRVVIIGDTPHDVACARANGCRVLGVATGRTPAGELAAAGADGVMMDLSDTEGVLGWLRALA